MQRRRQINKATNERQKGVVEGSLLEDKNGHKKEYWWRFKGARRSREGRNIGMERECIKTQQQHVEAVGDGNESEGTIC